MALDFIIGGGASTPYNLQWYLAPPLGRYKIPTDISEKIEIFYSHPCPLKPYQVFLLSYLWKGYKEKFSSHAKKFAIFFRWNISDLVLKCVESEDFVSLLVPSLHEKCPNTDLFFTEKISIFSANTEKYGPEITPYLHTFHAVFPSQDELQYCLPARIRLKSHYQQRGLFNRCLHDKIDINIVFTIVIIIVDVTRKFIQVKCLYKYPCL